MTLLEMLVAGSVSLVILVVIVSMFSRGLTAWEVGQRRASAQQSGLLAMHEITHHLQVSDVKSVTFYPTGDMPQARAVSFISGMRDGAIQHDSYGEILWQKFAVYYFNQADATLRYHEEPIATPEPPDFPLGRPTRDPDPLTITSFTPSTGDRIVIRNLKALSFSWPLGGGNPVSVGIETGDEKYTSSLASSVVMENGFLKANPIGKLYLAPQLIQVPITNLELGP